MKLTKEEFKKVRFIRECVVEIPSLQTNIVKVGDTEIEIVTDYTLSEETKSIERKKWLELGAKLASMPRETEEKKALRKEYIDIKNRLRKKGEERETEQVSKNRNATRKGKLIKLPLSTNIVDGNIFSCELDCKEGDEVYFDAFWTQQEIAKKFDAKTGDDYIIHVEDKIYLRVPAVSLFCSVDAEGNYKGLNGFLVAEPLDADNTMITEGGIIINSEPKKLPRARVVGVSSYLPKFRNASVFMNTKVKKGDIVYTEPRYQTWLDKTSGGKNSLVRIPNFKILKIED
jgi:co-chaperonin GroES (HSP10)